MKCQYCKIEFEKKNRNPECSLKCRLLNGINILNECWIWKKARICGYGALSYQGKMQKAHRLSFELFKEKITKGKIVCHSCDNPLCINPDHLWLGSHRDNSKDAFEKGRLTKVWGRKKSIEEIDKIQKNRRIPDQKGEKHPHSKLIDADIFEIREMLKKNMKYRKIREIFSISDGTIADIKFKRTWSHI